MQLKPYVVLGEYYPATTPAWRAWRIGRALCQFTKNCGLVPITGIPHKMDSACSWYSAELQAGVRRTSKTGEGNDWHQDGDTTPGATIDQGIVLWANMMPTEIYGPSGIVYQPKPFEVVLINNLYVYHRRPANTPYNRWTFRQRVQL